MASEKVAYFHEMTDRQFETLRNAGTTWAGIMESFEQPKWCEYPQALGGLGGCWSLISRRIKCQKDCGSCDLIKNGSKP